MSNQPSSRKRLIQLGGLLAAAVVIVVIAIVVSSGGGSDDKTTASTSDGGGAGIQGVAETKALIGGIPQSGITLGKADAPVTIVEFADPQCPFCKQFTLNELPTIVQKHVRTGQAKLQLRYLTFIGDDSVTAAKALSAAGLQNRFWEASDLFYRNQGEENSGYVTEDFLTAVLKGAGADPAKALAAAEDPAVTQQLAEATTLASRYGVDSTPTILVGKTDGELRKDTESAPTAAGVGKMVDKLLAAGT